MTTATRPLDFQSPPALDQLTAFTKRYHGIIRRADEESGRHDATVYFEPDLHKVIQAFVAEAVKPLHNILADAMAVSSNPLRVVPSLESAPPVWETELWRGQHAGYWYRFVLRDHYRLALQVNTGMDTSDEHVAWATEWSR